MIASARHLARLFTIFRTLARHDVLFLLKDAGIAPGVLFAARLFAAKSTGIDERPGERLAKAFQELGPTFIKLGQILSTRPDILGDAVTADLADLQDRLPPFPGAIAKDIVAQELDAPLDALFSAFDDVPVAAASIAQVHFAMTADGDPVAVKVLRPGIEVSFNRDLELMRWVAREVERRRPEYRRLRPLEVVRTFEEAVRVEMDFRLEAAAADELAENFKGDPTYRVPAIDWRRTARRVMTQARIAGMPIDEVDGLRAAGLDPLDIVRKAAEIFFKQVFRDGFFHADQHPGNLFVGPDGAIVAVDFGIMGRLDRRTRRYLGEMLKAFLERDYRRVAEVHFEAGYVPADKSVDAFAQACRAIAEPIFDRPQNEISIARLLAQLFRVTETFEMETQPQLLLLQKTMLVAEGVGRTLAPQSNMWSLAQPLIEQWERDYFGPEARIAIALDEVAQGLTRLPSLVSNIEKSAQIIAQGQLMGGLVADAAAGGPAGRRRIDPEAYRRSAEAFRPRPTRSPIHVVFLIAMVLLVVLYLL
jgi:ubiquinone biosynthesis protein